jgi:hypothetical protein
MFLNSIFSNETTVSFPPILISVPLHTYINMFFCPKKLIEWLIDKFFSIRNSCKEGSIQISNDPSNEKLFRVNYSFTGPRMLTALLYRFLQTWRVPPRGNKKNENFIIGKSLKKQYFLTKTEEIFRFL